MVLGRKCTYMYLHLTLHSSARKITSILKITYGKRKVIGVMAHNTLHGIWNGTGTGTVRDKIGNNGFLSLSWSPAV